MAVEQPRCKYLFMTNVFRNLTDKQLVQSLKNHFPQFFRADQKIDARIYEQPREDFPHLVKCVAVISGVDVDIADLKRAARELNEANKFNRKWMTFIFKEDDGGERDELGNRMYALSSEDGKRYSFLNKKEVRHVKLQLGPGISPDIKVAFKEKKRVGLFTLNLQAEAIGARVIIDEFIRKPIAVYYSVMACFQGIVRFSGTTVISVSENVPKRVIFAHDTNRTKLHMQYGLGIGVGGGMLDIERAQNDFGYVPFSLMDPRAINIDYYLRMPSICYKCDHSFTILGLDKNLEYAAGVCKCDYSADPLSEHGAFRVDNEPFTRLLYHGVDKVQSAWSVYFPPMKKWYKDVDDYRRTVVPLLFWERQERIRVMNGISKLKAPISFAYAIEDFVDPLNQLPTTRYFVIIQTEMTKTWRQESLLDFDSITATLHLQDSYNNETLEEFDCERYWIIDDPIKKQCAIYITVQISKNMKINTTKLAKLEATNNLVKFDECAKFLRRWKNGLEMSRLLDFVLHPHDADLIAPATVYSFVKGEGVLQSHERIVAMLNKGQNLALETSLRNSHSVIFGPPGTGKTLLCAALMTLAASQNCSDSRPSVLAIVPTQSSAKALCLALDRIISSCFQSRFAVPLIFISSRIEEALDISNKRSSLDIGDNVKSLHFEIQKVIQSGDDEKLKRLYKKKYGGYQALSRADQEYLMDKTSQLETSLLDSYPIQIWTTKSALEERFQVSKNRQIDTLIVDEAGFIPQAFILPLLSLDTRRMIHVGDYRQLRGRVSAVNCDLAGLAISQMEWFDLSQAEIPSVKLDEQFRMRPQICNLVSKLTYNSRLSCAPTIVDAITPEKVQRALDLKSNEGILIINHNEPERKRYLGYCNTKEIKVIEKIWTRLMHSGISKNSVRIVTLYDSQKELLQNSSVLRGIQVSLVDEMQGQECDIVIASLVRSGYGIGYVKHQNRCNVMLSRARKVLILVMNVKTFKDAKMQSIVRMMNGLDECGAVIRDANEI